jgi:rhodanese-related sulfurtransferase
MTDKARSIDSSTLRRMLGDQAELALIDVREEGPFARDGHILLASNLPLSRLELRLAALVPRRSTRIVVCDGAEGLADIAAERMLRHGYRDVSLLEGGAPAWARSGERLYTGVYVPSKAFGEFVHHHDRPPEVTASDLAAWQRDGRELLILDSRPLDEYRRNTIPGSIDCPSAELAYRVHDLVRSPETTVVVNCGGRTRAIIGAQALINAGVPNKVYALKDGTQGWHLAGLPLARGRTEHAPPPTPAGLEQAKAAAARVARRFGVRALGMRALESMQADRDRTLYLLDVRTPEEYVAGHLPGALHAPGGQLVQATDTWLAVRRARVVLVDNDGVRATMTAAWLAQMGWEDVHVLAADEGAAKRVSGPERIELLGYEGLRVATVAPSELPPALAERSVEVVDVESSLAYREGHIPGAWHCVRSRLAQGLARIPGATPLVFTSTDGVLARYAAADAGRLTERPAAMLHGGTAAWMAAGFPRETGDERLTGPADDIKYRALDQKQGVEAAIREYLQWEVDLLHATQSDPDFRFRRFA